MNQTINSPCIGVCAMNEATGFCQGCYRTIEEITQWWDLDDSAHKEIGAKLVDRQLEAAQFD